jgi:hypothetical protein
MSRQHAFPNDVAGLTELLKNADTTEKQDRLWEQLFPSLHRVARNRIASAGKRGIERPTELVNDVFPGLQRAIASPRTSFESRSHFFAYAAQAMRRHLAAQARRTVAEELLDERFTMESASPALTIALNEALEILARTIPRAVRAWQLREYCGYSYEEILELMSSEYRTRALLAADLTLVRKRLVEVLRADDWDAHA